MKYAFIFLLLILSACSNNTTSHRNIGPLASNITMDTAREWILYVHRNQNVLDINISFDEQKKEENGSNFGWTIFLKTNNDGNIVSRNITGFAQEIIASRVSQSFGYKARSIFILPRRDDENTFSYGAIVHSNNGFLINLDIKIVKAS